MAHVSALVLLAALAVLVGAALQAATGFGSALVAAPLLFAATSPPEAVGLSMVLGLTINTLTLAGEGRRPAPLGGDVVRLLAWSVPGMLAGVLALRGLDERALQVLVTVGVVTSLVVRRRQRGAVPAPPPGWALPAAGLSAGALNTATSTAGPPLVLYLLRRAATPAQLRDTITTVFLAFSVLGIAALAVTGTEEAVPDPAWLAAGVPLVLAGHLAGRRWFARLRPEAYERLVTLLLLVAVVVGLLSTLA